MDVRNCKNCGRLFNYISGSPVCPACKEELEKKFNQVKEYIREHGKAGIQQIADDNDVDVKQIKQWIREERLIFAQDSPVMIECENCGAPIRSGKYCPQCIGKMTNNLAKGIKQAPTQEVTKEMRDKDRMRFLDKH